MEQGNARPCDTQLPLLSIRFDPPTYTSHYCAAIPRRFPTSRSCRVRRRGTIQCGGSGGQFRLLTNERPVYIAYVLLRWVLHFRGTLALIVACFRFVFLNTLVLKSKVILLDGVQGIPRRPELSNYWQYRLVFVIPPRLG